MFPSVQLTINLHWLSTGLVPNRQQDTNWTSFLNACTLYIADALEILQPCTKLAIWLSIYFCLSIWSYFYSGPFLTRGLLTIFWKFLTLIWDEFFFTTLWLKWAKILIHKKNFQSYWWKSPALNIYQIYLRYYYEQHHCITVNSSPPNAACLLWWIGSALV